MIDGLVFVRAILMTVLVTGTEAAARDVLFTRGGFVPVPRTFRAERNVEVVSDGADSHSDFYGIASVHKVVTDGWGDLAHSASEISRFVGEENLESLAFR